MSSKSCFLLCFTSLDIRWFLQCKSGETPRDNIECALCMDKNGIPNWMCKCDVLTCFNAYNMFFYSSSFFIVSNITSDSVSIDRIIRTFFFLTFSRLLLLVRISSYSKTKIACQWLCVWRWLLSSFTALQWLVLMLLLTFFDIVSIIPYSVHCSCSRSVNFQFTILFI